MKRDFDRIREILIQCESSREQVFELTNWNKVDRYQIRKMAEAGLVELNEPNTAPYVFRPGANHYGSDPYLMTVTFNLTWDGHDYLDAVRDIGVWTATKDAIVETGGSLTLEIAKKLALGFIKKKISKHTGIEI